MSLQANGADHHARLIAQNVRQAQHLAALVGRHPSLELMAPAPLNVVCFRYIRTGMGEEALDALNKELLIRVQESGVAVPSGAAAFVSKRSVDTALIGAIRRAGIEHGIAAAA